MQHILSAELGFVKVFKVNEAKKERRSTPLEQMLYGKKPHLFREIY
jgi:hypothetical protein